MDCRVKVHDRILVGVFLLRDEMADNTWSTARELRFIVGSIDIGCICGGIIPAITGSTWPHFDGGRSIRPWSLPEPIQGSTGRPLMRLGFSNCWEKGSASMLAETPGSGRSWDDLRWLLSKNDWEDALCGRMGSSRLT